MKYISVCSGIEAASVAWHSLGWEPVAFAEIDAFPSAVLAHHFPTVPNLGDISKVDWRSYHGTVDLVVGGTPCQSFSIAGRREGLDGASGLVFEYFRLLREVQPRWFVWENVPGTFSSQGGTDFQSILREWDKLGYHVAWRVLDAQFFGVPQRRRRIFAVGHLGNWRYPAKVLFEPDCLRWDTPAGGKARKSSAAPAEGRTGVYTKQRIGEYADCGKASTCSARDYKDATDLVVGTLAASGAGTRRPAGQGNELDFLIPHPTIRSFLYTHAPEGNAASLLRTLRNEIGEEAFAQWGLGVFDSLQPSKVLQQILHGCGLRRTTFSRNWVVYCALSREKNNPSWLLQSLRETECEGCPPQGWQPSEQFAGELGAYLSELSQPGAQAERFVRDLWEASEGAGILREALSAFQEMGRPIYDETQSALSRFAVRRLTPTEAEFLQGFPRNYTDIPWRGKEHAPDGPRYKALGNSMCVNVMRWIGERIQSVGDV